MLKYKIEDRRKLFSENIIDEMDDELKDMKFIVFEYLIPRPIFPPIKRMSRVFCFNKNQEVGNLGFKYRVFNILVCWIGLPFGPIEMISSNKKNKKGIDISDELRPKLSMADIKKGFIQLPLHESKFIKINNAIQKTIEQSLSKNKDILDLKSSPKLAYIKANHKHYFYVGFESNKKIDEDFWIEELKKDFTRKTEFIIVDLNKSDDLGRKMRREGIDLEIKN